MSSQFLRIENPGVAPSEAFTLFGCTSKRNSNNPNIIGTFGSGAKAATNLLLRADINPIVFCDRLRLSFYTRPISIKGVGGEFASKRVCVRYGGKDQDGKSRSAEEELSVTLDYGSSDWPHPSLALREIVSNAIDACLEQGLSVEQAALAVKIDIVDEASVRAKEGTTRVFVPLTEDVQEFFTKINSWFLHFSSPSLISESVLPKNNRSLTGSERPVIYRRGVYVREFNPGGESQASLFDFNLNNLVLNESRTADNWNVKHACAIALGDATKDKLSQVFLSLRSGKSYWEHTFEEDSLKDAYSYAPPERVAARQTEWTQAFESVASEDGCLIDKARIDLADTVRRKGYETLAAPTAWTAAAKKYGVRTEEKVLTEDDLHGRTFSDATPDVLAVLDWAWDLIEAYGMTCGKEKPKAGCYHKVGTDGSTGFGLYKNETVYVHADFATGINENLRMTVIEELCHHCTGNADFTSGFQEWLLRLTTRLAKATVIERQAIPVLCDETVIETVIEDEYVYSE